MNRPLWMYNLLLHALLGLAGPLVLPPLLLRAKWRLALNDRLGLSALPPSRRIERPLWVHALSVGEVWSALPLVEALHRCPPCRSIVFSATTLTGYRIARERLARFVDGLFFFPYDLPMIVRARLRQVRPAAVLLVETDLWPNFIAGAWASEIPVILVNAQMSQSSFNGYRRARKLTAPLFGGLTAVAAQTVEDADRLRALGAPEEQMRVVGNLKFDQPDPAHPEAMRADCRRRLHVAADQPVVVAGSTHRGEETALVEACFQWRRRFKDLVCVLAPRDPQRAGQIVRACRHSGLGACLWSQLDAAVRREAVVAVDRMGVLRRLYAAADLAFVGGSLVDCGGHNPLEPAALSRPILYGPDMSDFFLVADQLENAGGAVRVRDAGALCRAGEQLLAHPEKARQMGARARTVFLSHRGAVDRTMALVASVLEKSEGRSPWKG